jgi:hypothetical protein
MLLNNEQPDRVITLSGDKKVTAVSGRLARQQFQMLDPLQLAQGADIGRRVARQITKLR